MASASSRALVSAWPSGTTWPIQARLMASAAVMCRPVSNRSLDPETTGDPAGPAARPSAHRYRLHLASEMPNFALTGGGCRCLDLGAAGDRGPLDGGDQRFGQAAL